MYARFWHKVLFDRGHVSTPEPFGKLVNQGMILGETESEVKMILTTPFCPYAGSMIARVKEQAESVLDHPVKVTLLAERWDPRDAGLMW